MFADFIFKKKSRIASGLFVFYMLAVYTNNPLIFQNKRKNKKRKYLYNCAA